MRGPALVVVVLNLHKPRDRTHFEQFGQFHRSFYRAVEATSVTPWAARALDRALAAVVVAAARHIDPSLTPDAAVKELKNRPATRAAVRDAIVARAPPNAVPGGSAALAALVDDLLDAWIATADEQAAGGNVFGYAEQKSPHRLLHMPLAPEIANLSAAHRRFVAGRSMRDVEPSVALKPARSRRRRRSPTRTISHEQERAAAEPGGLDLRSRRDDRSADALGRRRRPRAVGDEGRRLHDHSRAAP